MEKPSKHSAAGGCSVTRLIQQMGVLPMTCNQFNLVAFVALGVSAGFVCSGCASPGILAGRLAPADLSCVRERNGWCSP